MTPEEAKAKYEAEWPALNAAKEAAASPVEAKKCRQQLSRLSSTCRARFELTKPEPELSEIDSLRQQLAELRQQVTLLKAVMNRIAFSRIGQCTDLAQELFAREEWAEEALAATKEQGK